MTLGNLTKDVDLKEKDLNACVVVKIFGGNKTFKASNLFLLKGTMALGNLTKDVNPKEKDPNACVIV